MARPQFIAGAYTATFTPAGGASADIGITREGFTVRDTPHWDPIVSDRSGQAKEDAINMGMDTQVSFAWMEFAPALPVAFAGFTQGSCFNKVGQLASSLGGTLTLTPATGTPAAATNAGKIWTFHCVVPASDIENILSSKLRSSPLTLDCIPNASGNAYTTSTS